MVAGPITTHEMCKDSVLSDHVLNPHPISLCSPITPAHLPFQPCPQLWLVIHFLFLSPVYHVDPYP